jgi:hypothetical protein
MRIKGTERTARNVEVEIDATEVLQQIRRDVYRSVGIPVDAYIDSRGYLVEEEEHYHGSGSRRLITETPSEIQVKTIEAFALIRQLMIRD